MARCWYTSLEMLDPASIERLAELPERNDPLLNVALAEEGAASVLLALAGCREVGPEALEVIAARIASEGDALALLDDGMTEPAAPRLDELLIGHPKAPASV